MERPDWRRELQAPPFQASHWLPIWRGTLQLAGPGAAPPRPPAPRLDKAEGEGRGRLSGLGGGAGGCGGLGSAWGRFLLRPRPASP